MKTLFNVLQSVNQLIIKSAITQLAPLTRHPSILWGDQINMSGLGMAHTQFDITPKYNYQDQ